MIVKKRQTKGAGRFKKRSYSRVGNCPYYKRTRKHSSFSKQYQEYLLCDLDKRIKACCSVDWYKKHCKKSRIQHLSRVVDLKCLLCVKQYPVIVCVGYCFNVEMHRLRTFSNYSINYTSALTLAADGFVYIGKNGSGLVICYRCKMVMRDTGWYTDVHAAHSQRSPSCPMVTLVNSDNIAFQTTSFDIEKLFDQLKSINSRLSCSQATDLCDTAACQGEPLGAGAALSDNHSQGNTNQSVKSFGITLTDYGSQLFQDRHISTDRPSQRKYLNISNMLPKHPNYAGIYERLKSFEISPPEFRLHKEQLSKAGFFYRAPGDAAPDGRVQVECFCCGLRMVRKPEEDIWKEHARLVPSCHYLLLRQEREIVEPSVEQQSKVIKDTAVLALLDERFPLASVLNAASTIHGEGQRLSADTLLVQVNRRDLPLSEEAEKTKQENRKLRSLLECKLCQKNQVEVVFLECGHLMACVDCAIVQKVKHTMCNECGQHITGLVRASITPGVEQNHETSTLRE